MNQTQTNIIKARKWSDFLRIIIDDKKYLGWFAQSTIESKFRDKLIEENNGLVCIEQQFTKGGSRYFLIPDSYKFSDRPFHAWLKNKKARQLIIDKAIEFHNKITNKK